MSSGQLIDVAKKVLGFGGDLLADSSSTMSLWRQWSFGGMQFMQGSWPGMGNNWAVRDSIGGEPFWRDS